jgi:hypothetical protein
MTGELGCGLLPRWWGEALELNLRMDLKAQESKRVLSSPPPQSHPRCSLPSGSGIQVLEQTAQSKIHVRA